MKSEAGDSPLKSGPVRVLLYSINFAPELTGIGKYNGEMAEWLTKRGYEVRVVTAPPYYPQWKVPAGWSASRYAHEERRGVRIWRCPVWVPKKASGLKRLLHLLSFAVSSAPVLLGQLLRRPDFVFVVEPPLVLSPLTLLLTKLLRIKSWLHVQDFEVDAAFELGLLPNRRWLKKAVAGWERRLMKGFDAVSTISEPMVRKLLAKGIPPERIRYFPNWVDTEAVRPLDGGQPNRLREELGIPDDRIVALYSGNMGEKQGLDAVLEAADRLRSRPDIAFVLCGDGVAKTKLMEEAARRRLDNVSFLPLQPAERLNELLNMADVHLLVQKKKTSDLVMPSKLTGMLASGKPVVATAEPGTAVHAVMEQSGAGPSVPPEDPARLAEALLRLAGREEERRSCGRSAREYAERHLGYDAVMLAFHQSAQELGAGSRHEAREQPHSVESL